MKNIRCRIGLHRWSPGHHLSVWQQDLGRAVRVRSKTCYRCGRLDEHVVRQKPPDAAFGRDDDLDHPRT
jgi:hypothetical protein